MFTKIFAVAALAGAAAAAPAGVTAKISPSGETAPSGCSANYPGKFVIAPQNVTSNSKRDVTLVSTLVDGVLTDSEGRTGYIASNNQYQYDNPPQAGALYTAGFSICQNGSLALGNSAIFYACLSGTFYNLYDDNEGTQCHPVYIQVSPYTESSTTGVASQISDGQVTASPVRSSVACQITDGQVQAYTCTAPISQIADGQIQAPTKGAVVTQIHDGQIQAATSTVAPVTQISDGQIQAPTKAAVVTQISDGQIQAPTNGTTVSTAKPVPYTGAASSVSVGLFSVVAGFVAIMAL